MDTINTQIVSTFSMDSPGSRNIFVLSARHVVLESGHVFEDFEFLSRACRPMFSQQNLNTDKR